MASRSRSPSPYSRSRPSPPPPRRHHDGSRSKSPYDDRERSERSRRRDSPPRRRRESPPRRRDRSRSYDRRDRRSSPPPRHRRDHDSRYPTVIDGFPILPEESFSDYRTRVRNSSTKTIWASSPERPTRSPSPEEPRRSSKKKHSKKRDVSESEEDTDSSEEEERRRRRHKKKHHKSSSSGSKHHKSSKRSTSSKKSKRRYSSEEEASDSEGYRKKQVAVQTSLKEEPVLEVDQSHLDAVEDLWVEKQVDLPDDLAPVGPVPIVDNDTHDARAYGGALLPGEGSAMAAYVQQGKRIPRRGEIGLSGDQISEFEKAGYVMSGSRHQRMNAVRLRKENQVISAEEKRLVLQHAQEQKMKRENEIISGFREILSDKFKKEE